MLITEHKLKDIDDRIIINLPDCFSSKDAYKEILYEISALTDGLFDIRNIEFDLIQANKWQIKILLENTSLINIEVVIGEYFDIKVLEIINSYIHSVSEYEKRNLVTLHGSIYDFAIGFIHPDQEIKLWKAQLIWRVEGWQKNRESLAIYQNYTKKESDSRINSCMKWVGYFKYNNEITLFKLIFDSVKDDQISGILYEGNDFENESEDFITFEGTVNKQEITYIKTYGDGVFYKLAKLLKYDENDVELPLNRTRVEYKGKFESPNYCKGKWYKPKTDIEFLGIDFSTDYCEGKWEMKLIE